MSDYRHSSHTTCSIYLPIVWITQYRYKALHGESAERVRALVREACQKAGVDILQGHISPDHGHVNELLARLLPTGLGRCGRRVAIDLIRLPYHGTVDEAQHDEVCRSKAKCGTTYFFTHATAYAVVRGRRSPLAICRVRAKQTMDHVVRPPP